MDVIAVQRNGIAATPGPAQVRSVLLAWLVSKRSTLTRQAYARDLGWTFRDLGDGTYHLDRTGGPHGWCDFLDRAGTDLLRADEGHVNLWMDELARAELAPATIARQVCAVSSLYAHLVRRRVLPTNPVDFVERTAVDPDESSTVGPDKDQARTLLAWTRGPQCRPRTAAVVGVLLFAGLRVSEAVLADVTDLGQDRSHRTLRVVRKGGKVRRVPLAGPAWSCLDVYLGDRRTGPLFLTRSGSRITRQQASDLVTSATRRAGLGDGFTAHSLRHGFATLALEAGVPLEVVQDAMGHADPRTTQRYNRGRFRLDKHPGYELAKYLGH